MKAKKVLGFLTGLVLLTLMFCPYMEASTQSKEWNCHSEPAAPEGQDLLSCCDNEGIPVQQFHIVTTSSLLQMLVSEETATLRTIHSSCYDSPLLYRTTGDLLSLLSVLRL